MASRLFLGLMAILFSAFGLWSITSPLAMAAQLGVDATGPAAAFEMRGIFGGVSLGAAILCGLGAIRSGLTRPALYFIATYMGGYAIGRLASLVAGDQAPQSSWIFAGAEFLVLLIATALIIRRK